MIKKRWIVELPEENPVSHVPSELLELATQTKHANGLHHLIYRDNFLAYKVSALAKGRVFSRK